MLVGIERGQPVDAKHGGKKQRLKASTQRLLPVLQQRKVVVGIGSFMGLYRLRESGHNRSPCPLLIEPMREERHANTRQTGRDLDERCTRDNRRTAFCLARATLGPIELPEDPEPIELADAHQSWCPSLCDL